MPDSPPDSPNLTGIHASEPWEDVEIFAENASIDSRSAGTVIEEEFELVPDEKTFLGDLLAHWLDMRYPGAPATARLRRQFFELIFQGWDSGFDPNELPKPINKSPQHIAVPVGKFKENLPVKAAKRKHDGTIQPNQNRWADAPAYLSVHFNPSTWELSTKWRDKQGGYADAEYVKLNDGITMAQAVEQTIRHRDYWELELVEKYNTRLIVSLAQSRIRIWGESGVTSAISPPPEHLELNGRLLQPELMSDGLKKMAENLNEVSEAMRKREERLAAL
ncbi:Ff.00g126380.m01.CDS01 [Fusarium sp. VM40]|nr:Ff.00g126380.m01.CDS01 [Fusarium sp. VM40]